MTKGLFGLRAAAVALAISTMSSLAQAGDVSVVDPWARGAPMAGGSGAVFMVLKNAGAADDALVAASSPVAAAVELHTHSMDDGVMRMRAVKEIPVPAGGEAKLQPGGLHIMLIDLKAGLQPGETVPLRLTFAKAGVVDASAPVRPMHAPMGGMEMREPMGGMK